jgi:hypothetical protein
MKCWDFGVTVNHSFAGSIPACGAWKTDVRRFKMTPEEFAEAMRSIEKDSDVESRHSKADNLMMKVLRELGYTKGIKIYQRMDKWYA